MSCPRCGQPAPAGRNFCTACGTALRAPTPTEPSTSPSPTALLRECPRCGASNAASRRVCGRCHSTLDETAVLAEPDLTPTLPPAAEGDSPRLLLFVTLVAGFVIVAVLLTLLGARGIGILRPPRAAVPPSELTRQGVARVAASSALAPAGGVGYEPANLIDGDPGTAWVAQGDVGEWVELTLDQQADVARLLVWNGSQRDAQFGERGRARTLLIDAAGRRFSVDLLDAHGSQAINLPEPVSTTKIRLTVETAYDGDRHPGIALSEVEVHGPDDRG